jgi:hypothetical protein
MAPATERKILPTPLGAGSGTLIASPFQFATDGTSLLRTRLWALQLSTISGKAFDVQLAVRSIASDGSTQLSTRVVTPTFDGNVNTFTLPLAAGFLQTVSISWAGNTTTSAGPIFAVVDLVRGTDTGAQTVEGQLLGGYVGPDQTLAWPGSPIVGALAVPGFIAEIETALAVGNEFTFTVPAHQIWRPLALDTVLSVGGAGLARWPSLTVIVAAVRCMYIPGPQSFAAGVVGRTCWQLNGPSAAGALTIPSGVASLPPMMLRFGNQLHSDTQNFVAGDSWAKVSMLTEVWIEPTP